MILSKQQKKVIKAAGKLAGNDSILLQGGKLHVTDLETRLIMDLPGLTQKTNICITAKAFVRAASLLDDFEFDSTAKSALLTAVGEKITLTGFDPVGFPAIPSGKLDYIGSLTREDVDKIQSALTYTSNDELRPALCVVLVTDRNIVATDAHRLFKKPSSAKLQGKILLNRAVIRLLKDIQFDEISVCKLAGQLLLDAGSIQIYAREPECKYPNYEAVWPVDSTAKISITKTRLVSALKKAMAFSDPNTYLTCISLKKNVLTLTAKYDGEYCSEIPADIEGEMQIGFNAKLFLTILDNVSSDVVEIKLTAPNRAALINDYFVLMPCMLP